jgi:hypothetical protein
VLPAGLERIRSGIIPSDRGRQDEAVIVEWGLRRVAGLSGQPVLTVFRVTMGVSFGRGFRTWSIPGSNVMT